MDLKSTILLLHVLMFEVGVAKSLKGITCIIILLYKNNKISFWKASVDQISPVCRDHAGRRTCISILSDQIKAAYFSLWLVPLLVVLCQWAV